MEISVSLMCANPLNMRADIIELEENEVDAWHIDIMDGVYVPNLAMNFDTVKAIKAISSVPLEAHLMVCNPDRYIDIAADAGVDTLTFHIDANPFLVRMCQQVRARGMKSGLAINPSSDIACLPYVLDYVDYLLFMAVEPGFAGQEFIDSVLAKIVEATSLVSRFKHNVKIAVDGNMNATNAARILEAGAHMVVGGTSSIFKKEGSISENLRSFRDSVSKLRAGQ